MFREVSSTNSEVFFSEFMSEGREVRKVAFLNEEEGNVCCFGFLVIFKMKHISRRGCVMRARRRGIFVHPPFEDSYLCLHLIAAASTGGRARC